MENSGIVHVLLPSIIPEGLSAEEMTRMERETRKQVLGYIQALRTYMPGMEHSELAVIGPSIGFSGDEKAGGKGDDHGGRRDLPGESARTVWPGADGNRRFTGMSTRWRLIWK